MLTFALFNDAGYGERAQEGRFLLSVSFPGCLKAGNSMVLVLGEQRLGRGKLSKLLLWGELD